MYILAYKRIVARRLRRTSIAQESEQGIDAHRRLKRFRQRQINRDINKFWALMSEVISLELVPLDYPTRFGTLLEHGVGLSISPAYTLPYADKPRRWPALQPLLAEFATKI